MHTQTHKIIILYFDWNCIGVISRFERNSFLLILNLPIHEHGIYHYLFMYSWKSFNFLWHFSQHPSHNLYMSFDLFSYFEATVIENFMLDYIFWLCIQKHNWLYILILYSTISLNCWTIFFSFLRDLVCDNYIVWKWERIFSSSLYIFYLFFHFYSLCIILTQKQ